MQPRILLAGLTAPIVGITVTVAMTYIPPFGSNNEGFTFTLAVFLLMGAPGAYLLEAAFGILVYRWMQRRNAITVGPVLLAGLVAGILAWLLPPSLMSGGAWEWDELGVASIIGAIGGLAAAAWFWFVYRWQPREGAA